MPPKTMFEKIWDAHVVHQDPGQDAICTSTFTWYMRSRHPRPSRVFGYPADRSAVPS